MLDISKAKIGFIGYGNMAGAVSRDLSFGSHAGADLCLRQRL
ncbi:MAG: hypothetical protein ACLTK0_01355 [Anaerovoracaceae bacterium]